MSLFSDVLLDRLRLHVTMHGTSTSLVPSYFFLWWIRMRCDILREAYYVVWFQEMCVVYISFIFIDSETMCPSTNITSVCASCTDVLTQLYVGDGHSTHSLSTLIVSSHWRSEKWRVLLSSWTYDMECRSEADEDEITYGQSWYWVYSHKSWNVLASWFRFAINGF